MTGASAIEVEGLSKLYQLGVAGASYGRLTEQLSLALRGKRRGQAAARSEVWALEDVSFEVRSGEAMGVLGSNGAGKSTLLKILTRITKPTSGRATIRGRVASLLEVGTGFHPELTGRENILLNGAILGMGRAETRSKLDAIVDFADVERFLDTPVKRYSSGMYTRLAFAVAAHLEPEILLVDEVLAVGDVAFQAKCLGRMSDFTGDGRTVIYVSHNMGSIARLCERCVWLEHGRLRDVLPAGEAIRQYLGSTAGQGATSTYERDENKAAQIRKVTVASAEGLPVSELECDDGFRVELEIEVNRRLPGLHMSVDLMTADGVLVLFSDVSDTDPGIGERLQPGTHAFAITVPERLLAPGRYVVNTGIASPYSGMLDVRNAACEVTIRDHSTLRGDDRPGVIGLRLPWVEIDSSA